MSGKCTKKLDDGKDCVNDAMPNSNYCSEHDPARTFSAGGGGGSTWRFPLKGVGKLYGPSR
jgi:hypothetical protein